MNNTAIEWTDMSWNPASGPAWPTASTTPSRWTASNSTSPNLLAG
jgi:hypothetical protein